MIATMLLATAAITHFERAGELTFDETKIEAVSRKDIAGVPVIWRGKRVVVRAKTQAAEANDVETTVDSRLAFEVLPSHRRFELEMGRRTVGCLGRQPDTAIRIVPFVAGFIASFHEVDCGAHFASDAEHLLIVDLRAKQPRATHLVFTEMEWWGYVNGGVLVHDDDTVCRWAGDDFDCTQHRTVEAPWAKFELERRFAAFGRASLPIASDDAPRAHDLANLAEFVATNTPVLVDGIGMLHPVMRVAPDAMLFASIDFDDRLVPTFYLASPRGVLPLRSHDVIEEPEQPSGEEDDDQPKIPFTRVRDHAAFRASVLDERDGAKLIQVVADIGKERALFWLAVAPADQHFAALRIAATAGEGQDRGRFVPPSVSSYHFQNHEATVEVVKRWIDDVFDGPRCDEEQEDCGEVFDGVISWSVVDFKFVVSGSHITDEPLRVTIAPDGSLGTEPRTEDDVAQR